MEFQETTVSAQSERYTIYNHSDKGRARYERRETTEKRLAYNIDRYTEKYLTRPFIAWDGEGITIDGEHKYVMLANSVGGYLENLDGIGTSEAFEFLLSEKEKYPNAIHVIFSGGYDINMMLRDLHKEQVRGIVKHDYWTVGGYRIQWRQAKSFYLGRKGHKGGITIYDVWPFFQTTFVKACDSYLGSRFVNRDLIVQNKGQRSTFQLEDLAEIRFYNEQELVNLVELVTELRSRLDKVGLRLSRWDGPGAIAAALLSRENIKRAMNTCPTEVARAARFAYAGGRFEVIRNGNVNRPAYEYDVNSAYPYGLGYVPNLRNGRWVYRKGYNGGMPEWNAYALYHVVYSASNPYIPGPLFVRMQNGNICYPLRAEGWYWGPEIYATGLHIERYGGNLTVLESWHFIESDPTDKPFAFIEPLYNKRRALKKAGDGAHVGIKLGLNSLYGKLCQQLGWKIGAGGEPIIPTFHQLEWAGYITSMCRAKVLLAAIDKLDKVIAFETDAVFSMERLNVEIGTGLGQFEETEFSSLMYATSGFYFATTSDGLEIERTRGVDRGTVTRETVAAAMEQRLSRDRVVNATLTRFIGAGLALHQDWSKWRTWQVTPKTIVPEPYTKRTHERCPICNVKDFDGLKRDVWHYTEPYMFITPNGHVSAEFPIEWINPNSAMTDLEELRHYGPEIESMYYE